MTRINLTKDPQLVSSRRPESDPASNGILQPGNVVDYLYRYSFFAVEIAIIHMTVHPMAHIPASLGTRAVLGLGSLVATTLFFMLQKIFEFVQDEIPFHWLPIYRR